VLKMARISGRFPMNIAYSYNNKMKSHLEKMHSTTYSSWIERIKKQYKKLMDAPEDEIEIILERLRRRYQMNEEDVRAMTDTMVKRTREFGIHQVDRQIMAVAGVSLNLRYPNKNARIKMIVEENVRLIKSLPERYYDDVSRVVRDGVAKGKGIKIIQSGLKKASDGVINSAKLIARDQVGSVLSEVTRQRHEQAGLEKYLWSSVGDARVRDNHAEWDGQVFTWKNGSPNGTHPGQEIQCRCIAQVVEKDVTSIYGKDE
jgi:SPP1 gp7 family putative phage head morphogenesis protein